MTRSVDLNSDNNDIIFNEDDESDFEVNGYMVKGFHLPENTAVVSVLARELTIPIPRTLYAWV